MDVCDFHAHILPNADHGSSSVEESLKQLALAKKFGVTRIIATSHFYPQSDNVQHYLAKRNDAYARLKALAPDGSPEVRLGAEVLLCPNLVNMAGLDELCVNGTKTILIELPFNDFAKEYIDAVEDIIAAGYEVVLAHAECYEVEEVEEFIAIGAKIQLNASALISFFKNPVIEDWKERGLVVAIGSDIHGSDKRAYKRFATARKKLGEYLPYIKSFTDRVWDLSRDISLETND